ncbi:TonB-dependent receptor [Alteromonadaceae bacterium M269]|nr:TonB-dependent receptor [Alteromonadaceae bacterium M269]
MHHCSTSAWRRLFPLLSLLLCFSSFDSFAQKSVEFDIDAKRADLALIEFAQQANQTLLFSFEMTSQHQTNALKGNYSPKLGLIKLLEGTALYAVENESGQLSINTITSWRNTKVNKKSKLQAALAPLLAVGAVQAPLAQEEEQNVQKVERINVVGSRVAGRSAEDLPVPVDILSAEALANTGQTEVGRMLQTIAPSFNFSSSSISDGTDALRPATLRGLGPDQTLVLINGKRRHQASLIHINTSVGRGTAGTDLNAIPAVSIKRIEILRDGAAAQYGSDAIAGVINLVLKDSAESGSVSASYGEYSEGDGETTNINVNKGFSLGDEGFFNVALNFRDRGFTNRAGLHGSCQFPGCTTLANGNLLAADPRELTAPRDTFRIGDAESEQFALTINTAYEIGDGELYGFITYSRRDNESAAFFRDNANLNGNPRLQDGDATIPDGFLPLINTEIDDVSYNFGYKTVFDNDASLDISYTYGENTIDYVTSDSINASFANELRFNRGLSADEIRATIPREADAYGLELTLQTINVDYSQSFGDLQLSIGAEIREDEYRIIPGEELSFADFDTINGVNIFEGQSGGIGSENASGGIQGFPGIGPDSAVDESRDVISFYVDAEYYFSDRFLASAAIRYDDYDGFGDTTNFKVAANYELTDNVRIRGAASTGFRAPSLQQLFFNNIGTQFVVNDQGDLIQQQVGTFRNDSELAQAIGIPELQEEESTNWSIGAVFNPIDSVSITVDYYSIDIDDRIVISNRLGEGLSATLDAALLAAGAGAGQFFLNGADTETDGIDIVATWNTELGKGLLDLSFAANFTETDVVNLFTPVGSGLETLTTDQVFSEQDISIIEEWQPEDRVSLSGVYRIDDFTVNLSFNRYGEYTVTDGGRQTYGAEVLTDLRVAYQLNDNLSFNIGANNLFDVTPDRNTIGNSRAGTIVDANGNVIVSSDGVFQFSRRSAPFGFNGAFYYAGFEYNF